MLTNNTSKVNQEKAIHFVADTLYCLYLKSYDVAKFLGKNMNINTKHPQYLDFSYDWQLMRDSFLGEKYIKRQGAVYLPPTQSMKEDGIYGSQFYEIYKTRAVYHDFVNTAVEASLGVMHRKPPMIRVPSKLDPLLMDCTGKGESIDLFLRRINEQQLTVGRLGLMLDFPMNQLNPFTLPYIAMYEAETIINWCENEDKTALDLIVLEETEDEFRKDEFTWNRVEKYRVLSLVDGIYTTSLYTKNDEDFMQSEPIEVIVKGSKLDSIPFVFCNTKDILASPDIPSLLGLAYMSLAVYRGEADYRQTLFMMSQDTLVVQGVNDESAKIKCGAGAVIRLPSASYDAKFIGVTGNGLSEQRLCLENDIARCLQKAAQSINISSGQKESGDALKLRLSSQTATLTQIALAGALALEIILKKVAVWFGEDPAQVSVKPNLDFVDDTIKGSDLKELMAFAMAGGMSKRTLHENIKVGGLTDLTYEEEQEQIQAEQEAGHFVNTPVTATNNSQISDIAVQDQEALNENPLP